MAYAAMLSGEKKGVRPKMSSEMNTDLLTYIYSSQPKSVEESEVLVERFHTLKHFRRSR